MGDPGEEEMSFEQCRDLAQQNYVSMVLALHTLHGVSITTAEVIALATRMSPTKKWLKSFLCADEVFIGFVDP